MILRACQLESYASHGTWLWPYFRDYRMRFRLVCLLTPSVLTLCLKDPLIRDNRIYMELLVGWVLERKDKKNSLLTINNYLLKRYSVTIYIYIYICETGSLAKWVECSPMVRETWAQFQVASYQKLLKWYLIPPCLILNNISYILRVKWSNPGKGVAPCPTSRCSSYWKGSLLVALDYGRQLYFLVIYIYIYIYIYIILVAFERQTIAVSGWWSLSYKIFRRARFLLESL